MTARPPGLRKIAEGREAEIYLWNEGEVLRLLREGGSRQQLEREVAAMRASAVAGVPVPRVGEVVEVDGRVGLVMERIEGTDLFNLVGRRPWKLRSIARLTGHLHARLNAVPAPEALGTLHERIQRSIALSPHVPAGLRAPAIDALQQLPVGDSLLHGDFHPGNIMASRRSHAIIDWVGAARGDPAADFARTLVLGRVSPMPLGVSRVAAGLFVLGRKVLMRHYERAYREAATTGLSNLDLWMYVRAVERFADDIPEERPALLRLVESLPGASVG